MSIKHREDSITGIRKREAQQTRVAESAVLTDGSIHLTLPGGHVCDGTMVKFCAPCSCEVVTGGIVINGETYTVVDSMLNCVTGFGGVWDVGAQISVVIDDTNKRAFLNNTSDPLPTLKLSEPPTFQTVGRFGQHAICGTIVYICLGSITNGEEIKYIWHKVTTKKVTLDLLVITESQNLDIATLGLDVEDEIVVACISGGNGGKSSSSSYGGVGGKGGDGSSKGGGGGAGAGYGAGGGGAADSHLNSSTPGVGGAGGSCVVQTVTIPSKTIAVTIGAAGTRSGGTGGTTSFGTLVTVNGGGGSAGGKGGTAGGGGGGGGGWYLIEGNLSPIQYGAGSDAMGGSNGGTGGNGGGYGNGAGAGGAKGEAGGDTTIGAGHGVVYIWY